MNLISSSLKKQKEKKQGQATTKVQGETAGSPNFTITVNYTLLEDTFVLPKEGGGDPEGGEKGVLWLGQPCHGSF